MNNFNKDIRLRINEVLVKYGIKQIDVAKETNVSYSTLSLWLQGKVKGTQIKLEETMEKWLNNFNINSKTKSNATKPQSRLFLLKGKRERPNFDKVIDNKGFGNLIPININVELEGKRFKDIFFWDYFEPYLNPEQFIKILIEDNNLPSSFETEIMNQLLRQIALYNPNEYIFDGEVIKTIKIDVRIEDKLITDQFEWDINNPNNKPEEFAKMYCQDLGLNTEFVLPIAHSIKEQIFEFRKNLLQDKSYLFHHIKKHLPEENKDNYNLSYLRDTILNETDFQPSFRILSNADIQKYEQKEDRKSRYAQRKK